MYNASPSERRRRKQKKIAMLIIVFSIVIVAVAGVGLWMSSQNNPTLDETTLCPLDSLPTAYWAVVIDVTDNYDAIQRAAIEKRFDAIKRGVPKHALLALYTITDEAEDGLKPILERCNPGTGEDVSKWTSNPSLLQRRWEEDFEKPLRESLEKLLDGSSLRRSPIMETIKAINVASFEFRERDRHLILISDMIQHDEDYSHYYRTPDFEDFRKLPSYSKHMTDLSGWDVTILYAERDDVMSRKIQGRKHINFWDEYFLAQGARIERVSKL